MSQAQYRDFGYLVENKLTCVNRRNDRESRERLWFLCGYCNSILIVVSYLQPSERELVDAGLLLDVRDHGSVASGISFFDFALHQRSSWEERVRLCNQIRDKFAARPMIRWCGGEYEPLFHPAVVQNACELNGLALLGRGMSDAGVIEGALPSPRLHDHTYTVISHLDRIDDHGQKKLAVIFHSVAISGATIVYVGSYPGQGWIEALAPVSICCYFRCYHHGNN